MAIKLVASYSKKLGLANFSSHEYSVGITKELQSLAEADTEMANLYHQLQRNVDAQIQETGFVPSEAYGSQPTNRPASSSQPQSENSSPEEWLCSPKQRNFVQRIVEENGLTESVVDQLAHQRFGRPAPRLNKMQASGLIDALLDQYGTKGKGNQR